ncbi:MAG: YggS family pyridoxal phosphate-dependent enzyme [Clostridia bacterium]|nr:YggS family pyridoxal phosphate-dependent enzyme [Clostridia bacterium]
MTEKSSVEIFEENFAQIKKNIKIAAEKSGRSEKDIILLAATKTVDCETINYAINAGVKYIGENRVQEFLSKKDSLCECHRHFIGHLQTNKVKDIIEHVELIHSVDSVRLAREISKQSIKHNKTMDILLEVNIGAEESKSGFLEEELILAAEEISKLPSIRIRGLMAIPPVMESEGDNDKYFIKMKKLFIDIGSKKMDNSSIDILSMGMSDDYVAAIEAGSNLVRIGTALFGKRIYK